MAGAIEQRKWLRGQKKPGHGQAKADMSRSLWLRVGFSGILIDLLPPHVTSVRYYRNLVYVLSFTMGSPMDWARGDESVKGFRRRAPVAGTGRRR